MDKKLTFARCKESMEFCDTELLFSSFFDKALKHQVIQTLFLVYPSKNICFVKLYD